MFNKKKPIDFVDNKRKLRIKYITLKTKLGLQYVLQLLLWLSKALKSKVAVV